MDYSTILKEFHLTNRRTLNLIKNLDEQIAKNEKKLSILRNNYIKKLSITEKLTNYKGESYNKEDEIKLLYEKTMNLSSLKLELICRMNESAIKHLNDLNYSIETFEKQEDNAKIDEICSICRKEGKNYKLISCTNSKCKLLWFHLKCLKIKITPKEVWYCSEECHVIYQDELKNKDGKDN